jgi:glutathione synthase
VKIGIVVNDIDSENPVYTSTRLAVTAVGRGHDVWYIGAGDFAVDPSDGLRARARPTPDGVTDLEAFLSAVTQSDSERISVDELDALVLRSDPAAEPPERSWAQTAGVIFGELAADHGVVVLNDPVGLSRALTKLYLQRLPREVRPATLVTRDADEVREFIEGHGGHGVLKPLQGSGGQGVFIVHPRDDVNISQMVEALCRDGYLIAQEYISAAAEGDTRLFLVDGEPLRRDGAIAAFRRIPAAGEARANTRAGAETAAATIDDTILHLVDAVRPHLVKDGMFFVGLDIVGDLVLEVNVFSPGGLGSAERATGVDFTPVVIEEIERTVEDRRG